MHTLLIADCSEDFCRSLSQTLQHEFRILSTHSGRETLSLLRREHPTILVLDLMLPHLDGISLLEQAAAEGISPRVLMISAIFTEYVLQDASRLGIEYAIRKPCDLEAVSDRIRDIARKAPQTASRSQSPVRLLLQLGFSPKHDGYRYLVYILPLQMRDPQLGVTKLAYPAAAHRFGCSLKNVEHAIRTAIEAAWKAGSRELWQCHFPAHTKRPTNAQFIAGITEYLRSGKE